MVATRGKRRRGSFEEALEESEAPAPPRKVRSSSFALTINTNQKYKTYDAMVKDLRTIFNATKGFFGDVQNIGSIVEIEKPGDTFQTSVGHVEGIGTFEYGERSGLHLHMVLTFHHCTDMRIDRLALKENMDRIFSDVTPGTYNNIQYLKNPLANTKAYITKYVHGHNLRMFDDFAYCENPVMDLRLNIATNLADVFPRVVVSS
jgi:hypothetical protein